MNTYQLLDSGDRKKLEQIGEYRIIRPAPQAIWKPFDPSLWADIDSEFIKEKGEKGVWKPRKNPEGIKRNKLGTGLPENWYINSPSDLQFKIEPNEYGNIGIFPEHWLYSSDLNNLLPKKAKILNAFTYTGSNCLDLVKAGHLVTVVDSAKTAITGYTFNLGLNNLSRQGQRLILEDTVKFLDREIRRGSKYDCVMIDAPSYGRGTKKEIFDIDTSLIKLFESAKKLTEKDGLIIFTLHSPRYTKAALTQTLEQIFKGKNINVQELLLEAKTNSYLTSGTFIQIQ